MAHHLLQLLDCMYQESLRRLAVATRLAMGASTGASAIFYFNMNHQHQESSMQDAKNTDHRQWYKA